MTHNMAEWIVQEDDGLLTLIAQFLVPVFVKLTFEFLPNTRLPYTRNAEFNANLRRFRCTSAKDPPQMPSRWSINTIRFLSA